MKDRRLLYSPSIMCADQLNLENDIRLLERYKMDYLHIDVMDLHFVPNITLGFDLINKLKPFRLKKDIHLMVKNIVKAVNLIKLNEGDIVSFHPESGVDITSTIRHIKNKGYKVGLVINPETDFRIIFSHLNELEIVHFMCVSPGFAGQKFITSSYDKVNDFITILRNKANMLLVGVDGAIDYKQIETFYKIGVNLFVLGSSALFKGNLEKQLQKLSVFTSSLLNKYDISSFRPRRSIVKKYNW